MIGLIIFFFWVLYAFYCEYEAFDINKISETDVDGDIKRFAICSVICFVICYLMMHHMHIDTSDEDLENFKNLLEQHGLKWSDLFLNPNDKVRDK